MEIKVNVEFDLSGYIEQWGDETLEQCIKDEVKSEVIRSVKKTEKYKELVRRQQESVMGNLDKLLSKD